MLSFKVDSRWALCKASCSAAQQAVEPWASHLLHSIAHLAIHHHDCNPEQGNKVLCNPGLLVIKIEFCSLHLSQVVLFILVVAIHP